MTGQVSSPVPDASRRRAGCHPVARVERGVIGLHDRKRGAVVRTHDEFDERRRTLALLPPPSLAGLAAPASASRTARHGAGSPGGDTVRIDRMVPRTGGRAAWAPGAGAAVLVGAQPAMAETPARHAAQDRESQLPPSLSVAHDSLVVSATLPNQRCKNRQHCEIVAIARRATPCEMILPRTAICDKGLGARFLTSYLSDGRPAAVPSGHCGRATTTEVCRG